jgi:hypothetical protein
MIDLDGTIRFGIGFVAALEAVTWLFLKLNWISWAEWTSAYLMVTLITPLVFYAALAALYLTAVFFRRLFGQRV